MFHPQGPSLCELVVQALSSTERGYDLLAPKFDYTPFRTPQILLDAVAAHLRNLGSFGSGLDLCCGTGAGMMLLRPLCRDRVVGVDFSLGMLRVCKHRTNLSPGTARPELVRGDVLALPFGPAFDIVTCFGALGHIRREDGSRFFGEVARVLRPEGRFAFLTTLTPPLWSKSYWLAQVFNGAMRLRNLLWSPSFIMYYLTFRLPEVQVLLEEHGLIVDIRELGLERPWTPYRLVIATRPPAS